MGWKGTVRSIEAGIHRAERNARRRQRELEQRQKQLEKMEELERAAYEVEVYENLIALLQSVHKGTGKNFILRSLLLNQRNRMAMKKLHKLILTDLSPESLTSC